MPYTKHFHKKSLADMAQALVLLLFIQTPAGAQPGDTVKAGFEQNLVQAYIAAFNGGDTSMRAFINKNFSETALRERSADERLTVYGRMRSNLGKLEFSAMSKANANSFSALIRGKGGLYEFTFLRGEGEKIAAIRVEEAEDRAPARPVSEQQALREIRRLVDQRVAKDEFSGVVLIARDGRALLERAYGMASKEFGVRNKPGTRFNIGSINKIFTEIAIGQLLEREKVSLSAPIGTYLPDYPRRDIAEKVTIRHLLDMSSGIGDIFGAKFDQTPKEKLRSIHDFLQLFATDSLEFEPGTGRKYSNGGYVVLGAIIERVSGEDYYQYVREHIFKPAGMESTDSYEADIVVPERGEGYTRENDSEPRRSNLYQRPARGNSAGGGYSTAGDLLKFTRAFEAGKFFTDPLTWDKVRGRQILENPKEGKLRPRPGMGIAGGAPGINAGVETGIGKGYSVIVLANYDPPAAESILAEARRILKSIH